MTGTISISKGMVIMLIVVPLAALLGFLLAMPEELPSLAIIAVVLIILTIPVLIQWHHLILIMSWNAALIVFFLPGQPNVWMLVTLTSLFWTVLNKTLNREYPINNVPWLTWAMIALAVVVLATAKFTGGMGLRTLGGQVYGGKKYYYILFAILAYFAISTPRIPIAKAQRYVTLYYLTGLTAAMANLLYFFPSLWFLFNVFPVDYAVSLATEDFDVTSIKFNRLGGLTFAAQAMCSLMIMRFGIRGILDFSKAWRFLVMLGLIAISMLGGFRSSFIAIMLLAVIQFFLEGLHRTRLFPVSLMSCLVGFILLIPFAQVLPLSVQRTLSVIPMLKLNPAARVDAQISTEWRLRMWEVLVPEIPRYLLLGKGYVTGAADYYLGLESMKRGFSANYEASLIAGDYHNGPLSVIIPFGIWGALAFLCFCGASFRVLYLNWKFGDARLKSINTFLFAAFITHFLFFMLIFGAIHGDIFTFAGLIGLSVSLNSGVCKPDPLLSLPQTVPSD